MYDFLIYSLKTAACLAVFYLFYKLLLSRETFHRVNRVVLLAVMAASFVLPLCIITVYRPVAAEERKYIDPVSLSQTPGQGVSAADYAPLVAGTDEARQIFSWRDLLGVVFIIGVGITLLFVLVAVFRVIRVVRTGEREPLGRRAVLVKKKEDIIPFSWVKYIVISRKDLAENGKQIISHEKAHLDLHHSFDLMLADLFCCLQWFNPAMWLLRMELTAIHEYEADRTVLASGADPREYQLLLIKKAVGTGRYSIANSLNHSKLKNRITMMLQKKSNHGAKAKILLLLPMVCLALTAFAQTEYVPVEDKVNEKNAETTFDRQTKAADGTGIVGSGTKSVSDGGESYLSNSVAERDRMRDNLTGQVERQISEGVDFERDKDWFKQVKRVVKARTQTGVSEVGKQTNFKEVIIKVDPRGRFSYNGKEINSGELEGILSEAEQNGDLPRVKVIIDKETRMGFVDDLWKELHDIKSVCLVIDSYERTRLDNNITTAAQQSMRMTTGAQVHIKINRRGEVVVGSVFVKDGDIKSAVLKELDDKGAKADEAVFLITVDRAAQAKYLEDVKVSLREIGGRRINFALR